MPKPEVNVGLPVTNNKPAAKDCVFCFRSQEDDRALGKIYRSKGLVAHYNCLLFASGLAQNGKSKDGIKGFLIQDIIKEVRRGKPWRCAYCKKIGATVGCNVKKCLKVFHFPCGLENGAMNHYFGTFESYCKDHKPKQELGKLKNPKAECSICFSEPKVITTETHLKSPCCSSGWFHRSCIQTYASSAGYFFKCPLCNDLDDFRIEMLKHGINIPDQDASWERERNAFSELLERPECGAENCLCPNGRAWNDDCEPWELLYCKNCGSVARHSRCGNLLIGDMSWTCEDCKKLEKEYEAKIFEQMKSRYGLKEFSIVLKDMLKVKTAKVGPVKSNVTVMIHGRKRKMLHKGQADISLLKEKRVRSRRVTSQKPPPSQPPELLKPPVTELMLLHRCQQSISNYMQRYGDCSTSTSKSINEFVFGGKENNCPRQTRQSEAGTKSSENFNNKANANLLTGEKTKRGEPKSHGKTKSLNREGLKKGRRNCELDESQMTILKYLHKRNDYVPSK